MKKHGTKAQELLEEFRSICEKENIEYEIAWGPEAMGSGVILSAEGCRRFLEAAGSRESGPEGQERRIESRGNNPRYPDATIRLVAMDSLAYNILDYTNYLYHGVFVEINVIRGAAQTFREKWTRACERGLYLAASHFRTPEPRKSDGRDLRIFRWGLRLSGSEEALAGKCFDRMLAGPEIGPGTEAARSFKAKTYSGEYLSCCIVEDGIPAEALFGPEGGYELLGSDLNGAPLQEARKAKAELDAKRKQNVPNYQITGGGWEIIREVDEELRAERTEAAEEEAEEGTAEQSAGSSETVTEE